jgi:hypothetical protein
MVVLTVADVDAPVVDPERVWQVELATAIARLAPGGDQLAVGREPVDAGVPT